MANIFSIIFMAVVAVIGGIPTLAITGYIPVMVGWKFYRKAKLGYSLYQ